MRVGEEEPDPGVREVLLGAGASPAPTAQRGPPAARPIGALRQPATRRGRAEQATVFLPAHRQLQPDAFVAAQERQVAVRRRRSDDLEASLLLKAARSEEHTSELQSRLHLVCRLLLEKKKKKQKHNRKDIYKQKDTRVTAASA